MGTKEMLETRSFCFHEHGGQSEHMACMVWQKRLRADLGEAIELHVSEREKASLAPIKAVADQLFEELLATGLEPTIFERNIHTALRQAIEEASS